MKKILAVLLATAMLFAAFAMPAFAATITLNTNNDGNSENFNVDWLDGLGIAILDTDAGMINYGLWMKNKLNLEVTYHFNAQCAVDYADETQDYEDYYGYFYFGGAGDDTVLQPMQLSSGKTIIKIDAEFHIHSAGEELWWGILGHTYTAGIDI